MGYKFLSDLYILLGSEDLNNGMVPHPQVYYSYEVNPSSVADLSNIFSHIFSPQNVNPFSITISLAGVDAGMAPHWMDKICLILGHPLYIKKSNQFIIGLHRAGVSVSQAAEFMERLTSGLEEQGYRGTRVIDMEAGHDEPDGGYIFYAGKFSPGGFSAWYKTQVAGHMVAPSIFLSRRNAEEAAAIVDQRAKTEDDLKREEPLLYDALLKLYARSDEVSGLRNVVANISEELSSSKEYLDFVLNQYRQESGGVSLDFNEVMKIKRFYYREYEILPTWYKKFGHIIKVVMGKRKFKSLFDDKLKDRG